MCVRARAAASCCAALALLAGYTYSKPLAGVVCFSGWAALASGFVARVESGANGKTPAFVAHGTQDPTVLPECGVKVNELLQEARVKTKYLTYPMGHSACPSEFEDFKDWLAGMGVQ